MSASLYHKLIIQVSLQKFVYVVKNKVDDQVIHFKYTDIDTLAPIEAQLDRIFHNDEILQASYNEILVLHDNNLNTLVPQSLFDETQIGSYLQYTTKIYPTDYFDFDELSDSGAVNVYVPFIPYNNYLIEKFGAFIFKHTTTNLIGWVLQKSTEPQEMFVCVHQNHFEVILTKHKKLIFFNSFEHQTKEDFIYYILFVFEQLQLNTNEIPVSVFGLIEEQDDYFEIAYKYIRHIKVWNHIAIAQSFSTTTDIVKHHFITLHS